MSSTLEAVLLLVALIFSLLELIRSRGLSLLAWAVVFICLAIAPWEALLR